MYQKHKKNSYLVYQIIGIILLCFSIITLSYRVTSAWFMDESITSNGEPNIVIIGTIDIDVTSNFNFYNLALAPKTTYLKDSLGQDIGTYIKTGQNNDIDSVYLRVKYSVSLDDLATEGIEEENTQRLSLVFDSSKITTSSSYAAQDLNHWVYNESDGYYYYLGEVGGETWVQFNQGYYVDNSLNNDIANYNVNINFQIEAIQKPYGAYKAVWTTAPTIFNTFAQGNSGV